jgi:hypothetical protein
MPLQRGKSERGLKMEKDFELVRKCLALVSHIAAKGASTPDGMHIIGILNWLTMALQHFRGLKIRKTGYLDLRDMGSDEELYQNLLALDEGLQRVPARDFLKLASRSTLN